MVHTRYRGGELALQLSNIFELFPPQSLQPLLVSSEPMFHIPFNAIMTHPNDDHRITNSRPNVLGSRVP
ncbi:hypothetical protein QCA50_016108 [Cerrena zonata]|uniref:Uncharacterized protein n=1 Tax=Cerrena zonata TaxID=2478898 RepID=A0AAW0FVR5_9APHY